jgi:sorbitol-6-phosphate 2-dehydrogenase
MSLKLLEGKICVLTGGAQGLGQALSMRMAEEGCHVIIADLKEDQLKATAAGVAQKTGCQALPVKCDVSQETDVQNLFDVAVKKFQRVDVVVSNAAILIAEPICDANAEKWRAVMNVNLFGNFLICKHACGIMQGQKSGSIIQINSKSGKKGSAANSAYAASKFGGIGLVQSVALEMAKYGVRCNAVCPGNLLDSPLWTDPQNGLFVQYLRAGKVPGAKSLDDVKQFYVDQVPLRRGTTYADIGNIVTFLASDLSSYMTGQAINITGGQEMR